MVVRMYAQDIPPEFEGVEVCMFYENDEKPAYAQGALFHDEFGWWVRDIEGDAEIGVGPGFMVEPV